MYIKIEEFHNNELKAIHLVKRYNFYSILAYLSYNGYGNCIFKNNNKIHSISLGYNFHLKRFNKKDYKKEILVLRALNKARRESNKIILCGDDDIIINNYEDLEIIN